MNLTDLIKTRIRDKGPISIAEYMELALMHPEQGYYTKRDPFGARGDFITAPEISQIFGEMVGIWCATMWALMGGGPMMLVELGPGRGTLMSDLLRATQHAEGFQDHLTIHMVEKSPTLQSAQFHTLREQHDRIEWVESFDEIPEEPMILIANEFLDALPIRQHVKTKEGMRERLVSINEETGELEFVLGKTGLSLAKGHDGMAEGVVMESCPAAKGVMVDIATHLRENGGAALLVDYGYLGDSHRDTLQAVKNHAFHPVLKDVGDADITAHVDFQTLVEVAKDKKLSTHGPTTQGTFLTKMGAEIRLERLIAHASPDQKNELVTGLRRLIDPMQMGELFKVLAVTSHHEIKPVGF